MELSNKAAEKAVLAGLIQHGKDSFVDIDGAITEQSFTLEENQIVWSCLKKLFEDHYIDVPDEKYNVLEDQSSKIEELEKKLNESIEKNVELSKENGEHKRQNIIDEASEDLADTQKEKFNKLAEEVEYSNEEDFKTKVATIKESYFGKKESTSEIDDVAAESNAEQPQDLTNAMAAYSAAISKTKDIKLSN